MSSLCNFDCNSITIPSTSKIFLKEMDTESVTTCTTNYQLSKSKVHDIKFGNIAVMLIHLHFQNKPLMNLKIFATIHSLRNDIDFIDSCQAHLHVQDAWNIEFIHQK